MRRSLLLLLAAAGLGCERPSTGGSYVIGDTTVVFSEQPLRALATLREVLRIGVAEGAPEFMFSRISMFTVGPRGTLYVADSDGDLRAYDADGGFLRAVARQGQGPGEVDYVVGMDVDSAGRLAVLDFGNQRVSIYSPDGTFERQIRRPLGRPGYGRDAIRWDSEGSLWLALHPLRSGPDTLGAGRRPLYGRLVADATVADTVFLPTRAWDGCTERSAGFAGGFFEDGRLPYQPFAQWALDAGGALVFGCSASYSFDIVRPEGVLRVSRQWEPEVMTQEEHDYYRLMQERSVGIPSPRFPVPRERPAFLRIWRPDDGRTWLWRGAAGLSTELTEEQREGVSRALGGRPAPRRSWTYWSPTDGLDVFGPEGRWIGHVVTPESWDGDPYPGLGDPLFLGDTVWATTKDEFDLRYLSKFVVEWRTEGGNPGSEGS